MDIGILIPPTPRASTLDNMQIANERMLSACQKHGLTAWFVDHFQFAERAYLECFALLAHSAGRFPGLKVGTLVLGQGYRNPALVAKSAASLHFLTGGNFILGIGAGWKEDEYRAYGWPFPKAGQRLDELDEAVRIIKSLWAGGPTTFVGKHYRIEGAICEPRPVPPPPLMIGGGGEQRTLRLAAEHADWWNVDYLAPANFARKLSILHGHCRDVGRDPSEVVPTAFCLVSVSCDESKLVKTPPANFPSTAHILSGNPSQIIDQINEFGSAGAKQVQLSFLDYPTGDGFDLFENEVLPAFKRAGDERNAAL